MAAQSHMVTHSHSGMPLHIQSALQEKKKQDSERRERQGKGEKKEWWGGEKEHKTGGLNTKGTDGRRC